MSRHWDLAYSLHQRKAQFAEKEAAADKADADKREAQRAAVRKQSGQGASFKTWCTHPTTLILIPPFARHQYAEEFEKNAQGTPNWPSLLMCFSLCFAFSGWDANRAQGKERPWRYPWMYPWMHSWTHPWNVHHYIWIKPWASSGGPGRALARSGGSSGTDLGGSVNQNIITPHQPPQAPLCLLYLSRCGILGSKDRKETH